MNIIAYNTSMIARKLPRKVPLDEKDKAILRALLRDPRTSTAEVARETGVQRDTVLHRVEKMEKRGLISKYHTIIEPEALGMSMFVLVLINAEPVSHDILGVFVEKLVAHAHVTHVARLVGNYDYFVQVAAEDIAQLDGVLSDIKCMGQGVIRDVEVANIIDGLKTDDFSALV